MSYFVVLTKSDHAMTFNRIKTISQLVVLTMGVSLSTGYANALDPVVTSLQADQVVVKSGQTNNLDHRHIPQEAYQEDQQEDQQENQQEIKKTIATAIEKDLANHPSWLRLHYYQRKDYQRKGRASEAAYDSKVKNRDFFISDKGRTDPQAELIATLEAMLSNTSGVQVNNTLNQNTLNQNTASQQNPNQESRNIACQFPARTHWLKTQLGLNIEPSYCPELEAWQQQLDPKRLSVIFAEEYLDNPLSAFGHTLLLIDSSASLANPADIDKAHALNATVGGDPNDSFVKYAAKSMVGSYPNDITIEPFPEKLAYYLQGDNRDVWTYPLVLTDSEVQQIMRHVWETKDIEIPYYFTKDNCASEILRYIDIVRPNSNLVNQLSLAVVPSDIIRLLKNEGLIVDPTYTPADDTLAQAKRNNQNLSDLPESSIGKNGKLISTELTPVDNNPLNAHSIQRAMIGAGQQDDVGYVSLAYRGGFNDLLDRPSGYPQNFDLEGVSLELRVYENADKNTSQYHAKHDQVELENVTLIRGRSFNPINTAQSGDSALATWGLNLEVTQVKDGSEMHSGSHLVASAAYEKGVSFAFGVPKSGSGQLPPQLCYALATGIAQVGKGLNNGYRVGAGANLGCRYQFGSKSRLVGEMQLPYWYHGDIHNTESGGSVGHYWQPILSLGAQYDIDKNQAVRVQGRYQFQERVEDKNSVQISYVKYF